MFHVYLLQAIDCNKSYIGMTNDPMRRLKQHNGDISGGARATRGWKWQHVMIVSGFPTKRDALQFEWYWKHVCKKMKQRGIVSKMEAFVQIWKRGYSSSSSTHFCQIPTPFFLSFSHLGQSLYEKIESFQSLPKELRAPSNFQISDYFNFQLFSFPATFKMSSISNTLVDAVDGAVAKKPSRKPKTVAAAATTATVQNDVVLISDAEAKAKKSKATKTKVEAEVVPTEPVETADPPKEKKSRKPKTAKPAEDGDDAPLPVPALPGSTVALATTAVAVSAAPIQRSPADVEAVETTDTEAKAKKPRKPRTKKVVEALPDASDVELHAMSDSEKIAYLLDQVKGLKHQLTAVLSSHADEKKPRKKRETKAKAVCPEAEEGVIRFHSTLKNDYKALSNSHKSEIRMDGVVYPTVEHYYQCARFLKTAPEYAEKIRNTANPALVKNMGRTKKVDSRADWESVHLDVMRKALRAKFSQHAELADLLRHTGTARLEEESPSDPYWGIGADGEGENLLGVLLAELREGL
jgi:hypothetical protein